MKNLFLFILLSFGLHVAANDSAGRGVYPLIDEEIAEVKVVVSDVGETRDVLNVFILCADKRSRPHAVKPRWEQPARLTDVPICLYRPRPDNYDAAAKKLSIHYSRFKILPGGRTECAIHERSEIDLRKWCHAFQP